MSHGNWKYMFKAIQNADTEWLPYYYRMGIDFDFQHPEYFTSPLIECIRLKKTNITMLLLQYGASPDLIEMFSNKIPSKIAEEINNFEAKQILEYYINKKSMNNNELNL